MQTSVNRTLAKSAARPNIVHRLASTTDADVLIVGVIQLCASILQYGSFAEAVGRQ